MLKKIYINKKEIPVPVPLKDLATAVLWATQTFLKKDEVITSIFLGDKDYTEANDTKLAQVNLTASSRLSINKESPQEISMQTLDTIRDLAHNIQKMLKFVVLRTWEAGDAVEAKEIDIIRNDIDLLLNLVTHLNGILNKHHQALSPINGLHVMLKSYQKELVSAFQAKNYKACSKLFVTRYEELLRDLTVESEDLQLRIMANGLSELQNPLMVEQK